eukprot:gnl/Chilomastix_cuspidata/622.p1 GENE.gnl/Chilomastix_cuspidata/622~~gnl/Chilomastix_cuspidata/622.p1  ORF type:complete len:2087 (+),score=715.87 gnl/Chilomastix_cuspidata/622:38-6262(+)
MDQGLLPRRHIKTLLPRPDRARAQDKRPEEPAAKAPNLFFNPKRSPIGTKLLSVITEIHDDRLIVSVPNRLHGTLMFSEVSDVLSQELERARQMSADGVAVDDMEEIDIPSLTELYRLGEFLPVVFTERQKKTRRIVFSARPSVLNAALNEDELGVDEVVAAQLLSEEEHGFAVCLKAPAAKGGIGVRTWRGFLPKPREDGAPALRRGKTLLAAVQHVDRDSLLVTLSAEPSTLRRAALRQKHTAPNLVSRLLPGQLVNVTMKGLTSEAFGKANALGGVPVTIPQTHFPRSVRRPAAEEPEEEPQRRDELFFAPEKGSRQRARIVQIDPETNTIFASFLSHVVALRHADLGGLDVGSFLEGMRVAKAAAKLGVWCRLRDTKGEEEHADQPAVLLPLSMLSDTESAELDAKKHALGCVIPRVRVTSIHAVDGVVVASAQKSVLNRAVVGIADAPAGTVVRGRITRVLASAGLLLQVAANLRALVPFFHLVGSIPDRESSASQMKLVKLGERLVGKEVSGMVISRDKVRKRLIVSLKPGLLKAALPTFVGADIGGAPSPPSEEPAAEPAGPPPAPEAILAKNLTPAHLAPASLTVSHLDIRVGSVGVGWVNSLTDVGTLVRFPGELRGLILPAVWGAYCDRLGAEAGVQGPTKVQRGTVISVVVTFSGVGSNGEPKLLLAPLTEREAKEVAREGEDEPATPSVERVFARFMRIVRAAPTRPPGQGGEAKLMTQNPAISSDLLPAAVEAVASVPAPSLLLRARVLAPVPGGLLFGCPLLAADDGEAGPEAVGFLPLNHMSDSPALAGPRCEHFVRALARAVSEGAPPPLMDFTTGVAVISADPQRGHLVLSMKPLITLATLGVLVRQAKEARRHERSRSRKKSGSRRAAPAPSAADVYAKAVSQIVKKVPKSVRRLAARLPLFPHSSADMREGDLVVGAVHSVSPKQGLLVRFGSKVTAFASYSHALPPASLLLPGEKTTLSPSAAGVLLAALFPLHSTVVCSTASVETAQRSRVYVNLDGKGARAASGGEWKTKECTSGPKRSPVKSVQKWGSKLFVPSVLMADQFIEPQFAQDAPLQFGDVQQFSVHSAIGYGSDKSTFSGRLYPFRGFLLALPERPGVPVAFLPATLLPRASALHTIAEGTETNSQEPEFNAGKRFEDHTVTAAVIASDLALPAPLSPAPVSSWVSAHGLALFAARGRAHLLPDDQVTHKLARAEVLCQVVARLPDRLICVTRTHRKRADFRLVTVPIPMTLPAPNWDFKKVQGMGPLRLLAPLGPRLPNAGDWLVVRLLPRVGFDKKTRGFLPVGQGWKATDAPAAELFHKKRLPAAAPLLTGEPAMIRIPAAIPKDANAIFVDVFPQDKVDEVRPTRALLHAAYVTDQPISRPLHTLTPLETLPAVVVRSEAVLGRDDVPRQRTFVSLRQSDVDVAARPSFARQPDATRVAVQAVTKPADLARNHLVWGYVKAVTRKGVFVTLSPWLDAFVRLSETTDRFTPFEEIVRRLAPGALVKGRVLEVSADGNVRLTLKDSVVRRETPPLLSSDIREGLVARGRISRVERFGVFVRLVDAYPPLTGLARPRDALEQHDVDANAESLGAALAERFTEGQDIFCAVLSVDAASGRFFLGLRVGHLLATGLAVEEIEEMMRSLRGDGAEETSQSETDEAPLEVSASDDESEEMPDDERHAIDVRRGLKATVAPEEPKEEEEEGEAAGADDVQAAPFSFGAGAGELTLDAFFGDAPSNAGAALEETLVETRRRLSEQKTAGSAAAKAADEEETRSIEAALLDRSAVPGSVRDFERVVASHPQSSYVWLQYVSFLAARGELKESKATARRALAIIPLAAEDERMNIWLALALLEHRYGTRETFLDLYAEAAARCDRLEFTERVVAALAQRGQTALARELFEQLRRRREVRAEPRFWLRYARFLLERVADPTEREEDASAGTRAARDEARELYRKALLSVPERDELRLMSGFAQLEYRFGSVARGREIFESFLPERPRRSDLWGVYLDMETKFCSVRSARALFERVVRLPLAPKRMSYFFKRFYRFEKEHGTPDTVHAVRELLGGFVRAFEAA